MESVAPPAPPLHPFPLGDLTSAGDEEGDEEDDEEDDDVDDDVDVDDEATMVLFALYSGSGDGGTVWMALYPFSISPREISTPNFNPGETPGLIMYYSYVIV